MKVLGWVLIIFIILMCIVVTKFALNYVDELRNDKIDTGPASCWEQAIVCSRGKHDCDVICGYKVYPVTGKAKGFNARKINGMTWKGE